MRARIALVYSGINCILREVDLKNKPPQLLDISPKGTVPVIQFNDGSVLEESIDIINHSLSCNDKENILENQNNKDDKVEELIRNNDIKFVKILMRYKYFERFPEKSQEEYRLQAEQEYFSIYDNMLSNGQYLLGKKTKADIAIFPFIRQFAYADKEWFFNSKYKNLIKWHDSFNLSPEFEKIVMKKHKPWKESDKNEFLL